MPVTASLDWRETDAGLAPYLVQQDRVDRQVHWAAQAGSQDAFLSCPVFEALCEGNRGGGKTESPLNDFAQHVGEGWGKAWRGVLFGRTYPELEDVMAKADALFSIALPRAVYNRVKSFWQWPDVERLYFRQFMKPSDYWSYHGHSYPFIAWKS